MTNIVNMPTRELTQAEQAMAETFLKANEGIVPAPENEIPGTCTEVMVAVVVSEKDTGFEFKLEVFAKEKPTHACAQMALQIQTIVGQALQYAIEQHNQDMAQVRVNHQQEELPLEVEQQNGLPLGDEVPSESYLEYDPSTRIKDISEND